MQGWLMALAMQHDLANRMNSEWGGVKVCERVHARCIHPAATACLAAATVFFVQIYLCISRT